MSLEIDFAEQESTARIARDQAQRIAALWQRPVLSDEEAAEALSLPYSSWALLKKLEKPPVFNLGRRVYIRTADLSEFLARKAGAKL